MLSRVLLLVRALFPQPLVLLNFVSYRHFPRLFWGSLCLSQLRNDYEFVFLGSVYYECFTSWTNPKTYDLRPFIFTCNYELLMKIT